MLQSPPPALPSKPVSLFFAKAPELSNPPLSMDEIGDLLEENGGDDLSHINKEINEVKRSVEENKIKKAPEMEARKVLQSEGVAHYRYTCMAARSELNLNKPKTLLLTDAQKAEALYRRTMQTHGPQAVTTPALAASSGSSTAAMRFMQSPPPTKTNVDHKNFPQKPEVSIANPAELLAKMKQRMNDQKAKAAREREKERAASNSTSSNPNKKSPAVSHSNKALNSSNPLKSSTLNFKIPKLNRTSLDLTRNDKTMHSSSSPAPSSSKPSQNNSQEEPKASSASLVELQDSLKKKLDAQLTKTRLMSNVVKKTQNVVVSKKRARHSSQKLKDSSDEDNVSEPKKKIQARVAPNNHKAQVEKPKEHKNSVEKKEEVEEKSTFDEKVLKQFFSKLSSPQNCDADEKNKLLGMLQNVVGGELSNKILKIIETKDDPSTSSAVSTHDEDSCDSYKKTESTKATKSEKIIKKPAKTVKRPRDETVLKEESKEPETDLLKPLPVKKSKRHKNELDRLNEDILNMFIRDDVLTASGRRICSAYKSTEQNSSKGRDKTPIRAIKSSLNYPPNLSLSQRRQLDQKFEIIVPDLNLTEDDMPVSARLYMENAKIKQEPITPKVLGKSNGTARKRTMPEKPFTRTRKSLIKKIVECENNEQDLADDEKTLEDVKSVVKCKKSASKRRYAWNKGIIRKKRSVPHKTGDMEEMEEETKPEKKTEAVLKNTNITIHAKNPEYTIQCCLCDFSFQKEDTTHLEMVQHFVLMHEDHEIFVSRLSPEDAKSIKESPMKITGSSIQGSKITFRCLLCPHPSEKCMQPTAWINHIGLHTGEYCFKCTQCDIRVADWKDLKVAQHLTGCKQAFFETVIEKSFLDRHLTGYLCDECNYVQINEKNLKKHVEMEHDGNDVKIIQISLCNYSDTRTSITPKSQKEETKYVNVVKKMSPTPSTSTANSIVEACDTNDDWEDMDDGEEWEDMDSDENQNNTKQKAASILEMINEESDKMKSKKKGVKSKGKKSSPHKKATPTKMSNQKSSKDAPENVQKADPNTQKLQEIAIDPPMPELTLKIASVQGGQRVNPNLVYQQCNRTGFAIENNNIAYKCFIAGCVVGCQFENNQRDKFLTHLKTVHKLELWNGYCRLCKKQVTCDKSNRIFEEVKHVEMIHIASGLIEETNTNFKDEKIQIRLKKLPGDNLSGKRKFSSLFLIP